jgi:3-methyladenine DNA glycosylase AlkD
MKIKAIMNHLKANSNPDDIKGMARFGITPEQTFGTKIPVIRALAKEIGKDRKLAQELWDKGYRETMIIATLIDEPKLVTGEQMDEWAADFTYWEICDQCISNLFARTPLAWSKAVEWSTSEHEGTKRAAFVMMARLAVAEKKEPDERFLDFFPLIKYGSTDERNDVKKGVNWALRQIGKRNLVMNKKALELAKEIQKLDSKAAKWVAADAIRELTDKKILERLKRK